MNNEEKKAKMHLRGLVLFSEVTWRDEAEERTVLSLVLDILGLQFLQELQAENEIDPAGDKVASGSQGRRLTEKAQSVRKEETRRPGCLKVQPPNVTRVKQD